MTLGSSRLSGSWLEGELVAERSQAAGLTHRPSARNGG